MKPLSSLPKFKLEMQNILLTADSEPDVLTYSSDIRGMAYAADTDSMLILTVSNGYLRIRGKDINSMIEELQYIAEDMKRRRRCR